jgi:heme-degrading monooxygenase HmoA
MSFGKYYAVIFTSQRSDDGEEAHQQMAVQMLELAARQKGFLGVESTRDAAGAGITVSYWESLEDIAFWREHVLHRHAQRLGKERWYRSFRLRIAQVVEDRSWPPQAQ